MWSKFYKSKKGFIDNYLLIFKLLTIVFTAQALKVN